MAYNGKEIITYSFGHYSSHVATHFFNIQEASFSYNPSFSTGIHHDVLFRDGINIWRKQTVTPRLILLDEIDALRCLSKEGYYKDIDKLQAEIEEQNRDTDKEVRLPTFNDQNDFIKDVLIEKYRLRDEDHSGGKYLLKSNYSLQNSVVSWSDYLITEFNNNTIHTMPKNTPYFESNQLFNRFDSGLSLWHKTNLKEQIEENTRWYLEEVDNLQGFQMLFDANTGYSGIACACLEFLRDEHSKKIILSVPNIYTTVLETGYNPNTNTQYCEQLVSTASSVSSVSEYSDAITVLSHIKNPWGRRPALRHYDRFPLSNTDMYHTSAILATALDLFSLPPRVQDSGLNMNTMYTNLNIYDRKYLSVGLCIPFPLTEGVSLGSILNNYQEECFDSLTPLLNINSSQIDIQCISSKGIKDNYSNNDYTHTKKLLSEFFSKLFPTTITGTVLAKPGFRIPRTFPSDIFQNISNDVNLIENEYGPLTELYGFGGLHNSKGMRTTLNDLYEEIKKISQVGFVKNLFKDSELTEYEQLFDNLKIQSGTYDDEHFI